MYVPRLAAAAVAAFAVLRVFVTGRALTRLPSVISILIALVVYPVCFAQELEESEYGRRAEERATGRGSSCAVWTETLHC